MSHFWFDKDCIGLHDFLHYVPFFSVTSPFSYYTLVCLLIYLVLLIEIHSGKCCALFKGSSTSEIGANAADETTYPLPWGNQACRASLQLPVLPKVNRISNTADREGCVKRCLVMACVKTADPPWLMASIFEWKFLSFSFFTMYSSIGSLAMRMLNSLALEKLSLCKGGISK